MNAKNLINFRKKCPHKRYDKADLENQFCIKYNKLCSEVIKEQGCESYKTYLLNVMRKEGFFKKELNTNKECVK